MNYAISSIIIGLSLIIVMYFIIKKLNISNKDKAALFLCSAFGNVAFLGIPISYSLFGEEGAVIAGVFSFFMLIYRYSIGLYLSNNYLSKGTLSNQFLKKPFLWIMILVFILAQFKFKLPFVFSQIASFSTFLAIFIIGTSVDFKLINWKLFKQLFFKMILAPLIALVLAFILSKDNLFIFVLLGFMPSAFMNTTLAIEFNFNDKLSASLTTLGTVIFIALFGLYVLL